MIPASKVIRGSVMGLMLVMLAGCGDKEEASSPKPKPREEPTFESRPAGSQPAGQDSADPHASLHRDPSSMDRGNSGLPPGHPPIEGMSPAAQSSAPAPKLTYKAPADWKEMPARMMTDEVYALPKAEGDPEDGDLAVSTLGQIVDIAANVERWCGQFKLPDGQTCATAAKKTELPGTKYPTTIVEIAGSFLGRSMFAAPSGPAKPDYRMLTAEVRVGSVAWYFKLLGPSKTVDKHREAFMQMIREAQ